MCGWYTHTQFWHWITFLIPCSVLALWHFLSTMSHFGYHASFWVPCLILSTMPHFGYHALFWVPCLILSIMLHFEYRALFCIPSTILDSTSHFELQLSFWTPYPISVINPPLEDHASSWNDTAIFGCHPLFQVLCHYFICYVFTSLFRNGLVS